jgi:undecaprenyl diphosphate synthase
MVSAFMTLALELESLEASVKSRPLPKHVGIIMDGNGRWAETRHLPRLAGHREGSESVKEVTRAARSLGIEALTLYAFSSQNWARPAEEVAGLMELLREYLEKEREEILSNQIRLSAAGDLERLPRYVRDVLDKLREDSSMNRGMVLTLALSYGGREEILRAAQRVASAAMAGALNIEQLSAAEFEKCLWTHDLPAVDLIIRTSGESRLSNFLLWQSAYAELLFTDTLWPDFRKRAFLECLLEFQQRERRFGKTAAQLKASDLSAG